MCVSFLGRQWTDSRTNACLGIRVRSGSEAVRFENSKTDERNDFSLRQSVENPFESRSTLSHQFIFSLHLIGDSLSSVVVEQEDQIDGRCSFPSPIDSRFLSFVTSTSSTAGSFLLASFELFLRCSRLVHSATIGSLRIFDIFVQYESFSFYFPHSDGSRWK